MAGSPNIPQAKVASKRCARVRARDIWGILAILISLGAAIIIGAGAWGGRGISWMHWWVFSLTWIGIIGLVLLSEKDPISPLWVLFAYLFAYFFLRPFFVLLTGGGNLFGMHSAEIDPDMFLISSAFLFCIVSFYLVGYRLAAQGSVALARGLFRLPLRPNNTLLSMLAWLMVGISLLSFIYVVAALGGLREVMSKQAALVLLIPEKGAAVKLAWTLLYLYFAGVTLMLIRYGPSKSWLAFLLLGVIIFMTLGRRSPLLGLLVPLVVYRHFYVRRFTIFQATLGGLAIFALFITISIIRFFTAAAGDVGDLAEGALLESAEFFIWDMNMATLAAFGDVLDYRWGLDFIPYWLRGLIGADQDFLAFHAVGEAQVSLFYAGFPAGIPSGIFGTLFMDFGWLGVAMGAILIGWFSKFIHNYFLVNKENKLLMLLGYPFFLAAFFYMVRLGDPWLGIAMQGRVGFILLVLMLFITGFRLFRLRKATCGVGGNNSR